MVILSLILWLQITSLVVSQIEGKVFSDEDRPSNWIADNKSKSRFSLGLFTRFFNNIACRDEEEYNDITVKYMVDIQGESDENEDFLSHKKLETILKDGLNAAMKDSSFMFYSFHLFTEEEEITGIARGMCSGINCNQSPEPSLPDRLKKRDLLFDKLKQAVVELPFSSYIMQPKKLNKEINYNLLFEQQLNYPWKSLKSISLIKEEVYEVLPKQNCLVDEKFCSDQRNHIVSIFQKLGINDNDYNFHECSWSGVVCDNLNRITELYVENHNETDKIFPQDCTELIYLIILVLRNNSIKGPLPTSLDKLRNLRLLSLDNNKVSGSIPSTLGNLENLEELRLSRNELVGYIPSGLRTATELKILDLSRNGIVGSIPSEIGDLKKLTHLILFHNSGLTGNLPKSIGTLLSLEYVLLRENNFSGYLDVFSQLPRIKILDLAKNNFEGTMPNLKELTELSVLNLYKNELSGSIHSSIYDLHSLSEIILATNNLCGTISKDIRRLRNLMIFDVASNEIVSTIPTEFGLLKDLKILNLNRNSFRGSLPSELGGLQNLVEFVLSNNKLEKTIPPELGKNSNMKFVDLGNNFLSGTVPTTFNDLEKLTELYIWDNKLTGNTAFLCDIDDFEYDAGEFVSSCTFFQDQKNIIAKIYQELNAGDIIVQSIHECEWDGITCRHRDGRKNDPIVEINLAGISLSGSMSTEIGKLHELKRIDLSENSLKGTIPSEIMSLIFLEKLDLSGNDIDGDASFLCNASFQFLELDDDQVVRSCTSVPSITTSGKPSKSLIPTTTPSTAPSPVPSITPSVTPSTTPSSLPFIKKYVWLPKQKGLNSCPSLMNVSQEDCEAVGLALGGTLRNGAVIVGSWSHTPFGCFIGASDNAIHYSSNTSGENNGGFGPVCKNDVVKTMVGNCVSTPNVIGVKKEDCVAAGLMAGGSLRNGKLVLGTWDFTPYGCFVEPKSNDDIHYNSNIWSFNKRDFVPVCRKNDAEHVWLPKKKGLNSCPSLMNVSQEDCEAVGLALGGTLRNGAVNVGSWSHTPFGCFIGASDSAIHYSSNTSGENNGGYGPVCKNDVVKLQNYHGSVCASGLEVEKDDCVAAGLMVGGVLRDDALVVGYWTHVPYGCSLTYGKGHIHYNYDNDTGVNNGDFMPVCRKNDASR